MHTQNQTQRQLLGKSLTIFAFIAGSCASHGGSYMKEARRYPIRSNGHIVHKAKIYKAYEKHKAKQAAEESQSDKVEKVVKSQFTATSNMKGRYNLRSQAHITGNIQGNNIHHRHQPLTSLEIEQQKHGRSFGMSLPIPQKVAKNTNQDVMDNDPDQPSTSNATAARDTAFSKSMGDKNRHTKRAASGNHNVPKPLTHSTPVQKKQGTLPK